MFGWEGKILSDERDKWTIVSCIFCIRLGIVHSYVMRNCLNLLVSGQSEEFLVKSDNQSPLSSTSVEIHMDLLDERRSVSEKTKRSPLLELYPGQSLLPSAKIKLQLFPIDEGTCVGLEKVKYRKMNVLNCYIFYNFNCFIYNFLVGWISSIFGTYFKCSEEDFFCA